MSKNHRPKSFGPKFEKGKGSTKLSAWLRQLTRRVDEGKSVCIYSTDRGPMLVR